MKRKLQARRKQRGAVAVLAAIAVIAGLTAAMLAVEIGRLYSANRQLNSFASMAAMDSSRIVGGCDRSAAPTFPEVQAEIGESLTRNGAYDLFDDTRMEIALGYVTTVDGRRTLVSTPADQATAVSVTLREDFPQPFLPLLPSSDGREMVATAIATQEVVGLISVGTSLLTIDTGKAAALNRLLTPILGGGSVNLSVASYQGLANSRVTLHDMMVAADVATPGDLLDLQTDLPGALQIIGDALTATGEGTQVAAAGTLDGLVALVDPNRHNFRFGDFLLVEQGIEDLAAQLPINTLQLLMAMSENAAAGYPLELTVDPIPGLADITVTARIGSPATMAFGRPGYLEDGTARTRAHTSQVYVELSARITDLGMLPTANLLPVNASINLNLVAEIAQATATFTEVQCAWSQKPTYQVAVEAESGLARIAVGQYNNILANVPQIQAPPPLASITTGIGFLRTTVLSMSLSDELIFEPGENTETLEFEGPFVPRISAIVPSRHVAEIGAGVATAITDTTAGLTGQLSQNLVFGGLIGNALNLLGPVLKLATVADLFSPAFVLLDDVLADTLQMLGVEVGTATVTIEAVDVKPPLVFVKN